MYDATKNAQVEVGETSNFARQGSLRRVITGENNKENQFNKRKNELGKLYKDIHLEYIVLAEYKTVVSECIRGVYVIPSRENFLTWFGVIFIRSGLYKGGIFRFDLILDADFPNKTKHPVIQFKSKMFHPVVDPNTNELNCSSAFPKWDKNENHLWQLLKFLVWIFENTEASLMYGDEKNPAKKVFENNIDEFKEIVVNIIAESNERLYDEPQINDKHYIRFEPYDETIHGSTKAQLLVERQNDYIKSKNSWVLPGSLVPLGRPPTPNSHQES